VYQRTVKIYNGIDNTIEFDIKNADQKRIDLSTLDSIEMNVMDASGKSITDNAYTVTPSVTTSTNASVSSPVIQPNTSASIAIQTNTISGDGFKSSQVLTGTNIVGTVIIKSTETNIDAGTTTLTVTYDKQTIANESSITISAYDKGLATVVIPQDDLLDLSDQYLTYSVTARKNGEDFMLYGDSRFGATGKIELIGNAMPTFRDDRIYNTFTGEIDLKGLPTYHSSSIPAKFYEAVATSELSFEVALAGDVNVPGSGFVGSIWLEATTNDTISVDSFKGSVFLGSFTASKDSPRIAPVVFTNIPVRNYSYFRVSYQTPTANGVGAAFTVTKSNNVYSVVLRSGGTAYAAGSQMKVLGSLVGGIDGINDLIITADEVGSQVISSYTISSITSISWTGTASDGDSGTYIVSGTNITGKVVSVTVS
jgi:hypothetical protein